MHLRRFCACMKVGSSRIAAEIKPASRNPHFEKVVRGDYLTGIFVTLTGLSYHPPHVFLAAASGTEVIQYDHLAAHILPKDARIIRSIMTTYFDFLIVV
jgi:hypothetical protein